ncbi:MAG: hypothetical protein QGG53_45330 [Planctomycetota bacterium]|nr:hypothetical protein [Planctomycetota bacterium]
MPAKQVSLYSPEKRLSNYPVSDRAPDGKFNITTYVALVVQHRRKAHRGWRTPY